MILPAFILFFIFFIYPLIRGIGLSLTDYDGMTKPNFIGLNNFIDFFHDSRAKKDVINTVLFALGSAPLLNIFGFLYALLLDSKFKGKGIVRTIIYLPAVVSPLIMGYIWYFILQPQRGFLFVALERIGINLTYLNWTENRYMALWVVVIVNVWQFVGMTMVVYLAGLQGIPEEMHEAGKIDGATYGQRIKYIVLPMMIQPIKINVVTNIIGSLSVFEIILALTDGGPGYGTESLSIFIMRKCYGSFTGYSTAVAVILFLIILLPVLISLKLMKSKEYDA
jgi:raffinose/stachyose/melibiose transport system permease protein